MYVCLGQQIRRKIIFFEKTSEKIWLIQKKAVTLHSN